MIRLFFYRRCSLADLFQGAVLLGGSGLSPTALQQHPEELRQQLAKAAGCWDAAGDANAARYDLAPCLRRLSLADLMATATPAAPTPRFVSTFAPFVDGAHADPRQLMRANNGTFSKCDLLVRIALHPLYYFKIIQWEIVFWKN